MTVVAHAAVVEKKDAPFTFRKVFVEEPRADEVLVRMVASGICATDAMSSISTFQRRCLPSSGTKARASWSALDRP
jgi:Zn-dependent alcohol dehydrogenase